MEADKPLAIFVTGPTATGKTDLALELAAGDRCEIISVDSAQVYRGLDIGTAKPDAATRAQVPHHLIDIRDPADAYSAACFRQDALAAMEAITGRGRVPLLVGGTALYFKALVEPLAAMPPADAQVRAQLQARLASQGLAALLDELASVDPEAWQRIDRHNPQRVLRALEVWRVSGRPISAFWEQSVNDGRGGLAQSALAAFPWRLVQLAVAPAERSVLHGRIERRFQAMLDAGFEQEVRALHQRGDLHADLPAIRSVGYRQLWRYLDGDWDRARAVAAGIAATRQLAKRQLTWLRRWPGLDWLDPAEGGRAARLRKMLRKAGFS